MVFDALCEKSGPHLTIVDEVLHNKNAAVFKDVPMDTVKRGDVLIKREQFYFYRSLANNLRYRLLTLQSSHVSATDSVGPAEYNNLIDQIKVLSSEHWPEMPGDIDAV